MVHAIYPRLSQNAARKYQRLRDDILAERAEKHSVVEEEPLLLMRSAEPFGKVDAESRALLTDRVSQEIQRYHEAPMVSRPFIVGTALVQVLQRLKECASAHEPSQLLHLIEQSSGQLVRILSLQVSVEHRPLMSAIAALQRELFAKYLGSCQPEVSVLDQELPNFLRLQQAVETLKSLYVEDNAETFMPLLQRIGERVHTIHRAQVLQKVEIITAQYQELLYQQSKEVKICGFSDDFIRDMRLIAMQAADCGLEDQHQYLQSCLAEMEQRMLQNQMHILNTNIQALSLHMEWLQLPKKKERYAQLLPLCRTLVRSIQNVDLEESLHLPYAKLMRAAYETTYNLDFIYLLRQYAQEVYPDGTTIGMHIIEYCDHTLSLLAASETKPQPQPQEDTVGLLTGAMNEKSGHREGERKRKREVSFDTRVHDGAPPRGPRISGFPKSALKGGTLFSTSANHSGLQRLQGLDNKGQSDVCTLPSLEMSDQLCAAAEHLKAKLKQCTQILPNPQRSALAHMLECMAYALYSTEMKPQGQMVMAYQLYLTAHRIDPEHIQVKNAVARSLDDIYNARKNTRILFFHLKFAFNSTHQAMKATRIPGHLLLSTIDSLVEDVFCNLSVFAMGEQDPYIAFYNVVMGAISNAHYFSPEIIERMRVVKGVQESSNVLSQASLFSTSTGETTTTKEEQVCTSTTHPL